jgi:hypothetical protein
MEEEAPVPDVASPGQVQVQIPDHRFEILYSDQAFVSHTPVGFTIDFAQLTPQVAVSRVVARVGMSATHLKLLVHVLAENLEHYEKQYGAVAITPEMVQQHQQPAHHIGFQPDHRRVTDPGHVDPSQPPPAPGGARPPKQ